MWKSYSFPRDIIYKWLIFHIELFVYLNVWDIFLQPIIFQDVYRI